MRLQSVGAARARGIIVGAEKGLEEEEGAREQLRRFAALRRACQLYGLQSARAQVGRRRRASEGGGAIAQQGEGGVRARAALAAHILKA